MNARVAITGFGAVTPVGNDAPSTWSALVAGTSGVGRITTFDPETYPVKIAGLVKGFELDFDQVEDRLARHLSRAGRFGVGAALEALHAARVDLDTYEPEERGVVLGGSAGRASLQEFVDMGYSLEVSDGHELSRQAPSSVLERDQNVTAAVIAQLADCRGPMVSVSTACTSSAHSIGEAFRRIQDGEVKLMITGGYDSLTTWLDVLGFGLLGALTKDHEDEPERASRPFDAERSGFVLGEGAVIAILENLESARSRGAEIVAEVVGYGSTLNAYRMTDPPPDGGGVTLAMANAVDDAGMSRDQIDYVVAHGTSTPGNDLTETVAIKQVFGDHAYRLAISSPKSMTGHLTGAAGALNLLAAAGAIRDGVVPPTINLEHPDPKLDLDYVPNTARRMRVGAALVNAFAFGGTNGCLVVRRPEHGA